MIPVVVGMLAPLPIAQPPWRGALVPAQTRVSVDCSNTGYAATQIATAPLINCLFSIQRYSKTASSERMQVQYYELVPRIPRQF